MSDGTGRWSLDEVVRSHLVAARRYNRQVRWGFALVPHQLPELDYRHLGIVTAGGERMALTRALVEPALSTGVQWLGGATAIIVNVPPELDGHPDDEPLPYVSAFCRVGPSPPFATSEDTPVEWTWDPTTVAHYEPVLLLDRRPLNWPR